MGQLSSVCSSKSRSESQICLREGGEGENKAPGWCWLGGRGWSEVNPNRPNPFPRSCFLGVNPAIPGLPGAGTSLSSFRTSGRLQIPQIWDRGGTEGSLGKPPRLPIRLPGTEGALGGETFPQRPEMFMAPVSLPPGKPFIPEIWIVPAFLLRKTEGRGLTLLSSFDQLCIFPFPVWEQTPSAPRLAGMSQVTELGLC